MNASLRVVARDGSIGGVAVAGNTSVPILLGMAVVGGTVYTFGYLRAVMHRANRDYKTTKAALPGLRKGFWSAWWSAVKVGFWVLLVFGLLLAGVVHDVRSKR